MAHDPQSQSIPFQPAIAKAFPDAPAQAQGDRHLQETRRAEAPQGDGAIREAQPEGGSAKDQAQQGRQKGEAGSQGKVHPHRVSFRYLMRWGSKGFRPSTSLRYCSYWL